MAKPILFCEHCGAALASDARFCEQCGAVAAVADPFAEPPLPHPKPSLKQEDPVSAVEVVIGHIPVAYHTIGRWGRTTARDGELLITSQRILYLHNGFWTDDERWLQIQSSWEEQLGAEIDKASMPAWRAHADRYDFAGADWHDLYAAALPDLLAQNKHNFELLPERIVSADVTLDDREQDLLDLLLDDGAKLHFMIYIALGRPCHRFLTQALGPQRVQMRKIA